MLIDQRGYKWNCRPFGRIAEAGSVYLRSNPRRLRCRLPYLQWIREDHIEATPGEVVDYDRIRRRINELGSRFRIRKIALDRWNATQLATQLDGDGFTVVAVGQGYASMSAPTKKLEELVLSGRLIHDDHPVLRWMAGNVSIEQDAADNWKPSKKRSPERIDGIVALIMALDLASSEPARKGSIYEQRGPRFVEW